MSSSDTVPEKRSRARKMAAPEAAAISLETETPPAPPRPLFVAPISVRWRDLDAFNHVNAP